MVRRPKQRLPELSTKETCWQGQDHLAQSQAGEQSGCLGETRQHLCRLWYLEQKICGAANYGFQMSPPPSDTAFQRFTSSLPGCSLLFRLFLRGRRIYAAWATVNRSNNARQRCQADGQPPVGKKPEPPGCFVGGCLCGSGTHVHPTSTLHIITV